MYISDLESLEAFQNNCLRRILRSSWMDYITGVEVRRRCCGQPTWRRYLGGGGCSELVTCRGWVERDYQKPCFGERWMSEDKVGRLRLGGMV